MGNRSAVGMWALAGAGGVVPVLAATAESKLNTLGKLLKALLHGPLLVGVWGGW